MINRTRVTAPALDVWASDAEELLNVPGLEPNAGDAMWDSFYSIMGREGIRYTGQREHVSVSLIFERENAFQRMFSRPTANCQSVQPSKQTL